MWLTVKSEKPENVPVQQRQAGDTHLQTCLQDIVLSSSQHLCVRSTFKSRMPTSLQKTSSFRGYTLRSQTPLLCFTLRRSCKSLQLCTVCMSIFIAHKYTEFFCVIVFQTRQQLQYSAHSTHSWWRWLNQQPDAFVFVCFLCSLSEPKAVITFFS